MRRLPLLLASVTGAAALLASVEAQAQLIVKNPGQDPHYTVEIEPHLDAHLFGYGYGNYGYGYGGADTEFGAGLRATIKLVDPGFIPKLNNSVGISFGFDFTSCPNGNCGAYDGFRVWTPVTLQWNFFLTPQWSAFADLGFSLRTEGFFQQVHPDFVGMLGGRYHFNDKVALTMRIGYPFISIGCSFFAG